MEKKNLLYTGIILAAILIIIATGIIGLNLMDSHNTGQPARSDAGVTAGPAVPVTPGVTTTATDQSPGTGATTCTMIRFNDANAPNVDGFSFYNTTVFTAASAGNYSSPAPMKEARITSGQAKDLAQKAFPQVSPDRVDVEFVDGSQYNRYWKFDLYKNDTQLALGSLDPDTGELIHYRIPSPSLRERQEVPNPAISMDRAQATAENEIRKRNGEIPLKLVESRLDPFSMAMPGEKVAGEYAFVYRRVIHDVPSTKDGIILKIDSVTGNVTSYWKSWDVPENAVATQNIPAISRDAAIALVEREARACYPESADSFRVVSAELRWMDEYNQEKYTPSPGVIPLTWQIRFDDKTIRGWTYPVPEEGWVDAQNGTLVVMNYFHNRSGS